MARPQASKRPATGNQLASLSSEVLRLRLQALNLPVRGSRQQLITRLRSAKLLVLAVPSPFAPGDPLVARTRTQLPRQPSLRL